MNEPMIAGTRRVVVTGSNGEQDLRGLIADRPLATAVVAGTTFWAADRIGEVDEISISDGATWTNI